MSEITIQPNFIRVQRNWISSLIWDYYMYIDVPDYVIDDVLINCESQIPVKFIKGNFCKDGYDYIFCLLKCRHKYSKILTTKIFPQLHNKLRYKFGDDYLSFCEKCVNTLIGNLEADGKHEMVESVFSKVGE